MRSKVTYFLSLLVVFILLTSCVTSTKSEGATITVVGSASVTATPDTASFSISAETIADTAEEARNNSSRLIENAIEILKDEFAIQDSEIKTDYMNISPYYEWINGTRTLKGQEANQSLTITLKDSLDKVGRIYDRLSVLDGISISSISYLKSDVQEEMKIAREKATQNAYLKAQEFADGASLKVKRVISLSEGNVNNSAIYYTNQTMLKAESASSDYSNTTYYTSDITLSANVTAVFELE